MRPPHPEGVDPVVITAGRVVLKEFQSKDSQSLLEIRNHPSVRRGMRDPSPISPADHERFIARHLSAGCRQWVFLVRVAEATAGMTLLRDITADAAEIGVMLVDAPRHPLDAYFAAHMTAWFGFEILGLDRLISKVPRDNPAALRFNRKCGFRAFGEFDGYHHLVLDERRYANDAPHVRFRARWPIRLTTAAGEGDDVP